MANNFLITAWNDSGAGYLMRCLDNSPGVFSFPFEILLGAPVKAGIKELPDLVKPAYRWNSFRDQENLNAYWKVNPPQKFSDIFEESELEAWIAGDKFSDLQEIRPRVAQGLRSKYHNKILSSFSTPAYIEKYLDELEREFSSNPLPAMSKVLHCPCMMLDAHNPLFSSFFAKVITVTIDPAWGFGNMHQRNEISLDRYLERWRAINMASLIAVTNSPGTVLSIQTTPFPDQNLLNAQRAYEWITGGSCEACHLTPTLLGQSGHSDGYPYGGLSAANPEAAATAKATTESVLVQQGVATKNAYDECQCIFEQISAR